MNPSEPVTFPSTADAPGGEPAGPAPDERAMPSMPSQPSTTTASDGNVGGLRGSELLERMVRGAHASIDRFAETAAPQIDRLERGMSGAADSLHGSADHWREVGDEWTESVRTSVREHPLAAVGIALAAGMLIARLSR